MIAVNCGNPSMNLSNSNQLFGGNQFLNFTFKRIVMISCKVGFKWIDGNDVKNITCEANIQWTFVEPCSCMRLYLKICPLFL